MILLISATSFEIQPTIDWIEKQNLTSKVEVLISGVGSPATMFSTMKCIAEEKPDLIIQAGIAGSFKPELKIGEVVIVETEQWCDLGIEDHNEFHSLFDMKFTKPNELPYSNGIIACKYPKIKAIEQLRKVNAVTSNTAHGNQISIDKIVKKYNPDIETLEGAAVAYICAMEKIPFLQIRSISNIVEPRNREAWNIPLAIISLNLKLQSFLLNI